MMHWIIIVFCFVIGFGATFYGLKLVRLFTKVKSWPKLKARVLNKAVIDKKLNQASRQSKTIHVEYSYSVNGVEYKNDTVFLVALIKGERGFYPDDAERFLGRIKEEVDVFVDPKEPQTSVLYCEGIGLYLFMLVIGICLLLGGLGSLLSN